MAALFIIAAAAGTFNGRSRRRQTCREYAAASPSSSSVARQRDDVSACSSRVTQINHARDVSDMTIDDRVNSSHHRPAAAAAHAATRNSAHSMMRRLPSPATQSPKIQATPKKTRKPSLEVASTTSGHFSLWNREL